MEGDLGGERFSRKMRPNGEGDHLSQKVGEFPFLLHFHPSSPLAGRPLLLHSGPVSAAVAGTLLLLSAQGNGQRQCEGGWEGWLYSRILGWLVCVLCPKAVLACINISSMRQMFFQMQELPQLWRISRMDFVRNGSITPDCPLPFFQHPSLCPGSKPKCHGPKFSNPPISNTHAS